MSSSPIVSVLLPVYNEPIEWLAIAVSSMMEQTLSNWQLILVLDNPNRDDLWEFLQQKAAEDQRIICTKNPENKGLAMTLNEGAKLATGPYIARMDADDISAPDRLAVQLDFMQNNPTIALCGSQVQKMDEEGHLLHLSNSPQHPATIRRMAPYINIMTHPTFFMRKTAFDQVGGYRDLPGGEDYDIVLRLLAEGFQLANLPEVLLHYRVRHNGETVARSCTQKICFKYVQQMYHQRLRHGQDQFDPVVVRRQVQAAIDQYGPAQNQSQAQLVAAKAAWAQRKYLKVSIHLFRSVLSSPIQRKYYWDWLRATILQRISSHR